MPENTRRLAYLALLDRTCPECDSDLEYQKFEVNSVGDESYSASYRCPFCNSDISISIEVKDDRLSTDISKGGKVVATSEPSIGTLLERGHEAHQWIERIYELRDVLKILSTNLDRLKLREGHLLEWFEDGMGVSLEDYELESPTSVTIDVGRTELRAVLHTEIHNYLATAYTFDQLIETIRPDVIWSDELDEEFRSYKRNSRAILGLRHYVQHEGVPPLRFRRETSMSSRDTDVLTELSEVKLMDSQITVERSDGYREGAEFHYDGIEGPDINISEIIRKHMIDSHKLGMSIIEQILESYGDEIDEFEEYKEMHIHPDDVEPSDEYPDWEE